MFPLSSSRSIYKKVSQGVSARQLNHHQGIAQGVAQGFFKSHFLPKKILDELLDEFLDRTESAILDELLDEFLDELLGKFVAQLRKLRLLQQVRKVRQLRQLQRMACAEAGVAATGAPPAKRQRKPLTLRHWMKAEAITWEKTVARSIHCAPQIWTTGVNKHV